MGLWAGGIGPPNAGGSLTGIWVGYDAATSCAIVGRDPSSARSRAGGEFPSNEVSLVHMCFFWGHEVYFGGRPVEW